MTSLVPKLPSSQRFSHSETARMFRRLNITYPPIYMLSDDKETLEVPNVYTYFRQVDNGRLMAKKKFPCYYFPLAKPYTRSICSSSLQSKSTDGQELLKQSEYVSKSKIEAVEIEIVDIFNSEHSSFKIGLLIEAGTEEDTAFYTIGITHTGVVQTLRHSPIMLPDGNEGTLRYQISAVESHGTFGRAPVAGDKVKIVYSGFDQSCVIVFDNRKSRRMQIEAMTKYPTARIVPVVQANGVICKLVKPLAAPHKLNRLALIAANKYNRREVLRLNEKFSVTKTIGTFNGQTDSPEYTQDNPLGHGIPIRSAVFRKTEIEGQVRVLHTVKYDAKGFPVKVSYHPQETTDTIERPNSVMEYTESNLHILT